MLQNRPQNKTQDQHGTTLKIQLVQIPHVVSIWSTFVQFCFPSFTATDHKKINTCIRLSQSVLPEELNFQHVKLLPSIIYVSERLEVITLALSHESVSVQSRNERSLNSCGNLGSESVRDSRSQLLTTPKLRNRHACIHDFHTGNWSSIISWKQIF